MLSLTNSISWPLSNLSILKQGLCLNIILAFLILWLQAHDPENQLDRDFWNLQCILHETIGHACGKLATHTFKDGEPTTINGKKHKVGDRLEVTPTNLKEFLAGYEQTIEELRAEIIALYVSITHLDALLKLGFLNRWLKTLSKQQLKEQLIVHMANSGLRRLIHQPQNATTVSGDHARANSTIMNYLLDGGGLRMVQEERVVDGKKYSVLACIVEDLKKTINSIKDLVVEVQTIKSCGDGIAAKKLIEQYGMPINPSYIKIMQHNYKALAGEAKVIASIFPLFKPIIDSDSEEIVEIDASWPKDIVEQHLAYSKLIMSKEIG